MEFPLDQELNGGTQEFLMKLKNSKLQDDLLLEEFYDEVVESYEYGENYYIILIHAVYDVPGKTKDGLEMEDASDTVYEHILCSICPVNLTKAGLTYNAQTNNIEDRIRDWFVEAPVKGFLFPAFQDRAADVHNVLYYTKKPEELQPYFVEHVLGSTTPLTAGDQKTTFQAIVSDTLGEDSNYEVVRNIHDNLNEMIEQAKEEPEPLELSKTDVKKLLTRSGVAEEKLESFDDEFDEVKAVFYGKHHIFLVKRHCDGKSFLISPLDIIRIFDSRFRVTLEDCMSADGFIIDEDGKDKLLYMITNNQYRYVFPFLRLRPITVEVDATGSVIDSKGKRQVPGGYYFTPYDNVTPCNKTYVYLIKNNKSQIYTKDGHLVLELKEYNMFGGSKSDKYAIIENIKGDGKQNYFSFEKMCVCFDEWFDDCEYPELIDGKWLFKVTLNGQQKILDETGNEIK